MNTLLFLVGVTAVWGASFNQAPESTSWQISGQDAGSRFGWGVTFLEADGAGRSDAAVSAPGYGTSDNGRVTFYRSTCSSAGATGCSFVTGATSTVTGSAYNRIGFGLHGGKFGKTNDELWTGAACCGLSSSYVFNGPTFSLSNRRSYSKSALTFHADNGDFNGDGVMDTIIGDLAGSARVYLGTSTSAQRTVSCPLGSCSWYGFGVCAGNFDGDSYDDVVVCDPGRGSRRVRSGGCAMYKGASSGIGSSTAWTYNSPSKGAYFGWTCSSVDFDKDGYDDLIVGQPGGDGQNNQYRGKIQVFKGSASGLAAAPSFTIDGVTDNDEFGYAIVRAGDMDKDGYEDVMVGAPYAGVDREGAVAGVYGGATGPEASLRWTLLGTQPNSAFGHDLAGGVDVDGDGVNDLLVGAPFHNIPDPVTIRSTRGAAFLFKGQTVTDLSLAATLSVEDILAGDAFTATVTLSNIGQSQAEAASALIRFPVGVVFEGLESSSSGSVLCSDISTASVSLTQCLVGRLTNVAPNNVVTLVLNFRVDSSYVGSVSGLATADMSPTVDTNPSNNDVSLGLNVDSNANIKISLTQLKEIADQNTDQFWYALVINDGPSAALDVTLTFTVPVGSSYKGYLTRDADLAGVPTNTSHGSCTQAGGTVTCSLFSIVADAAVQVELRAKVTGARLDTLVATGVVATTSSGDAPGDNTASITSTIDISTDLLSIIEAATPSSTPSDVYEEGTISWVSSMTNLGPSNTADTFLELYVPSFLEITEVVWSGAVPCEDAVVEGTEWKISCDVGTLAVGGSLQLSVFTYVPFQERGAPSYFGMLTGTSKAVSSTLDGIPTNNIDTATINFRSNADLSVRIQSGTQSPTAGRFPLLAYSIYLANAGPSNAINAKVRFEMQDASRLITAADLEVEDLDESLNASVAFENDPLGFGLVDWVDAPNVTITIPFLARDESVVLQVIVDFSVTVTNSFYAEVVASSDIPDGFLEDNYASSRIATPSPATSCDNTIFPDPNVLATSTYTEASEFTWSFMVQNKGPITAFGSFVNFTRPVALANGGNIEVTNVVVTPLVIKDFKATGEQEITEKDPLPCDWIYSEIDEGDGGDTNVTFNNSRSDEVYSRRLLVDAPVGVYNNEWILCAIGDLPASPRPVLVGVKQSDRVRITMTGIVRGALDVSLTFHASTNVLDPMVDKKIIDNNLTYSFDLVTPQEIVVVEAETQSGKKGSAIALAIIIPLILLCIGTLVAWKLGFFKRKRPPKEGEVDMGGDDDLNNFDD